jgi:hypothetical protein
MATQVQWRGGSTSEHSTFTGAAREVTVDTQKKTLVVHDGSTAGGEPLLREDQANLPTSVTNGISVPTTNNVVISSGGTQRVNFGTGAVVFNETGENYDFRIEGDTESNLVFVDASTNRVGLGTNNPQALLHLSGNNNANTGTDVDNMVLRFEDTDTTSVNQMLGSIEWYGNDTTLYPAGVRSLIQCYGVASQQYPNLRYKSRSHTFYIGNSGNVESQTTEALHIDALGNVGIGDTGPDNKLHITYTVGAATNEGIRLEDTTNTTISQLSTTGSSFNYAGVSGHNALLYSSRDLAICADNANSGQIKFATGGGEAARIDGSKRLLVGTTSAPTENSTLVVRGNGVSLLQFGNFGTSANSALRISRSDTSVTVDNPLGYLEFGGNDSTGNADTAFAWIGAEADGDHAAGDNPTRLVFSTTADGLSSPTPRMTIKSDGDILFEKESNSSTTRGFEYRTGSENLVLITNSNSVAASPLIRLNRQSSDGDLISFRHADTEEGLISVSGTTVTYGGGHLARWSQLPNDEDPSNILKGTVMSNLDEMCEWGEEDNEQLNKTKVSDVEGDPNVAGVFVSTSFSEDGPLDFFVGMTGDMIIRIANGVTVQRGDLLMSAGDGTAKPQEDDIIRSKTIAKVTSTHVTCTYDDGSYCVPCVLMAC